MFPPEAQPVLGLVESEGQDTSTTERVDYGLSLRDE